MEVEIEILKRHFHSYEAVARELGVTSRTLLNVRKGKTHPKPLIALIKQKAETISDIPKKQ